MPDHKRNLKRVLISIPEEDLATLDNLAEALAEIKPNRSAAVRYLIDQSRYRPCPQPIRKNPKKTA